LNSYKEETSGPVEDCTHSYLIIATRVYVEIDNSVLKSGLSFFFFIKETLESIDTVYIPSFAPE